ncbi:ABC transporter permease [Lacrimispora sp. 210928-DFI.3.58]|uniref:ABC transporter permease n=1 Tax=Lacrimispora sp. 210928-DFI.3.58 TaxID=2883214 RepID=UPI001D07D14E|nr:ABC transporter permease [Lacrimispora sp. 210928-DFI.3.58]MCB7317276.1 ABC transporter permease [Lacrimispora sp. 210928-DFI.3.58]
MAKNKLIKNPVLRRFVKRPATIIGSIVLIAFFLVAILGPFVIKGDPYAVELGSKYLLPGPGHWLGTDNLGRDTLVRMIYGARTTLLVSFLAVAIGSVTGIFLGLMAGYFGGRTDTILSRMVDILMAFPGLLLAILVVAILGSGTMNTIIAISFFSIPGMARRTRGMVMSLKKREYVQACQIFGASNARILLTHILPNCVSLIIVDVTLALGTAILTSSSLSFLGLGVQPPTAEWGAMMNQAREMIRLQPIHAIIPGIAITMVVLSFSLVGDGLRDALDPKLKNS